MRNGRRALAAILGALFLLQAALAPLALAGTTTTFVEGDPATIQANNASSLATIRVPNPSRVVNASVSVSTHDAVASVVLPAERAWLGALPPAGMLERNISHFWPRPLLPDDVVDLSTVDGQNVSFYEFGGGASLAMLEFNATAALSSSQGPILSATFSFAGHSNDTNTSHRLDFEAALYEEPSVGHPAWRPIPLSPSALVNDTFGGDLLQPHTIPSGSSQVLRLVVWPTTPPSAGVFELDFASAALEVASNPMSPEVQVNATEESIWAYRSPAGGPAPFGRTLADAAGATTAMVSSNGTVAEGYTGDLYVPAGASIDRAYAELEPSPFTDSRSNASAGAVFSAYLGGATPPDQLPSIGGIPIEAHPSRGYVTLYNITAHGVAVAQQAVLSTLQTVGNLSGGVERSASQTVAVLSAGLIEAVQLNLANATGHPVGPFVLELRDLSGSLPGNTTLATGTANLSDARAGGWVTFTFATGVQAAANQQFALVLSSPGAIDNEVWEWRAHNGVSTDPYAAGEAFVSTNGSGQGPWVAQTNVDMAFRVLAAMPDPGYFTDYFAPIGTVFLGYTSIANYSGNSTGHRYEIEPLAISLIPDFQGGGRWEVQFANFLGLNFTFGCDVFLEYELYPRAVEVAVGNGSSAVLVSELNGPAVVDLGPALTTALNDGNYSTAQFNGTSYWLFPFRVRADGPADVLVGGYDIGYRITFQVAGLAAAFNRALALGPAGPQSADVELRIVAASAGALELGALFVEYSQPPVALPFNGLPTEVPEGSQNVTVADLYQWFVDDFDGFLLNYTVEWVLPTLPVATASIFESGVDGNLTLTLRAPEYSGPVSIRVRATDSTGLWSEHIFDVIVLPVPDAPWVLPIPDVALAGTVGTFDLAPYIRDNDTALAGLSLSVSSVFARLSGTALTFDYREAPASLLIETITLWVNDTTTNTSAPFRVLVNNAGRPLISPPAPITAALGHNITVALDPFVSDDHETDAELAWGFLRVLGVGATPGDGTASVSASYRTLRFGGTAVGDVEVGVTVEDSDGNLASGVFLFHVVADQPPSLGSLDGLRRTVASGGELRLNISEYLADGDDALSNFTFTVAWDNGTVVTAERQGAFLVIRSLGGPGGHARVTIVATDPAGSSASATVDIDVEPAPGGAGGLLFPVLGAAVAVGIGGLLFLSYRKGKAGQASLAAWEREDAEFEGDEEGHKRLASPDGLEETDEERMDHRLEDLGKGAAAPRHALPAVTIITPAGALTASELILAYRDGRPMSWAKTAAPKDRDTERAQELAAALETRARAVRPGGRIEGETVSLGGKQYLLEARSQLMLAALPEQGANAAALRMQMRAALDAVFDGNAGPLKRWDGSRAELKGVDDALEGVLSSKPGLA